MERRNLALREQSIRFNTGLRTILHRRAQGLHPISSCPRAAPMFQSLSAFFSNSYHNEGSSADYF
jgi:hypothetical protein